MRGRHRQPRWSAGRAPSSRGRADVLGARVISSFGVPLREATEGCDLVSVRPAAGSGNAGISVASGVVAHLRHDDIDVVIDDTPECSQGPRHVLDGREPHSTIVVAASDPAAIPPLAAEEGRSIAELDTLTPAQRDNHEKLLQRRARGPLSRVDRERLRRLRESAHQFAASVIRRSTAG